MADLTIHPLESWGFPIKGKLVIAGPCSAESEEQVMETALALAGGPVHLLRAGIWKPRTRPDSFEGVGAKGLKWLKKAGKAAGLPVVVEAACPEHVRQCLDHGIDAIWIGARTTVNPFAVQAIADSLAGVDIPVLVKNPVNPDVGLWIGALERLSRAGLLKLAAIHRGFSSFQKNEYRNRPHWEMVIELRRKIPHLPVVCDPSHICGNRTLLSEVSQTAMDLLMDGLMIECHIDPDRALSDAGQQLRPERLWALLNALEMKKESAADPEFHLQIDKMRRKIDDIDFRLMRLLGERMEISRMIGREKKKKKISILQPSRWRHIVKNRTAAGEKMNLSRAFTFDLFQKIHRESIRNQRLGKK